MELLIREANTIGPPGLFLTAEHLVRSILVFVLVDAFQLSDRHAASIRALPVY